MVNNVVVDYENQKSSEEKKLGVLKFLNKKNFKVLILIGLALFAGILLLSTGSSNNKVAIQSSTNSYYTTTLDYCKLLEDKLRGVLSSIRGAGNVSVMITVDGSPELVFAEDVDEKVSSNSSGSTTTSNSSSPIIVNVNGSSNALILTENLPQVKGVIVVSSGASDVGVKLDILNAVSTLLDISTDKVSVLKGI